MTGKAFLARSPWLRLLLVVSLAVSASTSCATLRVKEKMKRVAVTLEGTTIRVRPERVKIKRNVDIVVWATDGSSLQIKFPAAAERDPFVGKVVCEGAFCATLVPADKTGVFKYTVTVDGQTLDPEVEVEG